jgi:hypothetical protein
MHLLYSSRWRAWRNSGFNDRIPGVSASKLVLWIFYHEFASVQKNHLIIHYDEEAGSASFASLELSVTLLFQGDETTSHLVRHGVCCEYCSNKASYLIPPPVWFDVGFGSPVLLLLFTSCIMARVQGWCFEYEGWGSGMQGMGHCYMLWSGLDPCGSSTLERLQTNIHGKAPLLVRPKSLFQLAM